MKALLIINPISGTHSKHRVAQLAPKILEDLGWSVEVVFTRGPHDATHLAQRGVNEGFDAVMVAGGDGTINETAAGLCGTKIPMGILPSGSGNGLARHFQLPMNPIEAAGLMLPENVVAIDYGLVNGYRPFICTLGMGFDAAVSQRFAEKNRRGKMTYVLSTFETFREYKPDTYTITLPDGVTFQRHALVVAICNASQYGNNAFIAPGASVRDGLFDVTIIHSGNTLKSLLSGFDLMMGRIDHNTLVETFRVPSIKIKRGEGRPIHIDGEPVDNMTQEIDVHCCHEGLKVFCRPDKEPFRPIVTPLLSQLDDLKRDMRQLFIKENRQS